MDCRSKKGVGRWLIHSAKLCAEEFEILKIQANKISTRKRCCNKQDLRNRLRKAIQVSFIANPGKYNKAKDRCSSKTSSKPLKCRRKTHRSNRTAREGQFICALAAASQIIKRKELTRDDRLDACMAILENITTNKLIINDSTNTSEIRRELLCASSFYHDIATILGTIVDLYQNKKEPDELSLLIEEVISLEDGKRTTKNKVIEKSSLDIATERNLTIKELS